MLMKQSNIKKKEKRKTGKNLLTEAESLHFQRIFAIFNRIKKQRLKK